MKTRYILTIIFLSSFFYAYTQSTQINAKILCRKENKALPYANIQIENTGIGTMSDRYGRFELKIPKKYNKNKIVISYIGYDNQRLTMASLLKKHTVFLEPVDTEIQEVVVMSDSTLLDLLKHAYKRIPINYPTKPTKLRGFYRELMKTTQNQYLYFAECVSETYKSSCKNSLDHGQVKIIKSVINEFNGADTLNNTVFYAGLFAGTQGDFAKKKIDFILPKYFKHYNYTLLYTTKYQNNEVYVIGFDTKNDSLKGEYKGMIYIDKNSLAYVMSEYELTERGIKNLNKLHSTPFKYKKNKNKVFYTKFNDKWHIKYCVEEDLAVNKTYNSNLISVLEYMVTNIQTDSVKPIPYDEQCRYGDIFTYKANEYYSDNYWSDYNTLSQDSFLTNTVNTLYTPSQSKDLLTMKVNPVREKLLIKILKNISFSNSIVYLPVRISEGQYNIHFVDNNLNESDYLKPSNYNLAWQVSLDYRIRKRWKLSFGIFNSLNNKLYAKSFDLGFSYDFVLINRTNPLILQAMLLYSNLNIAKKFSTTDNTTDDFKFAGKNIDAEKFQLALGVNINAIKPTLKLNYNVTKRLYIHGAFSYLLPIKTVDKVYLKEKSGFFLKRKKANIQLNDQSIEVSYNDKLIKNSNLTFDNYLLSIGITIIL